MGLVTCKGRGRESSQRENCEEQLLNILKDTDENKTFMLPLIPGLKELNNDLKFWVKMEILNIMRRAKNVLFKH
jgi:hypothetical protein